MVKFIKTTCQKFRTGESEQNRTEQIAEGRSFIYLLMFIKVAFKLIIGSIEI